jgi:hypothetical protein
MNGDHEFLPFGVLTPHEIYRQIVDGPGDRSLDAARTAVDEERGRESDRARMIRLLAEKIRGGWQGEASATAFGAAMPLARYAIDGSDQLKVAHDLMSRQSDAFHETARRMSPVPEKPPESNIVNDLIPFETDLDREIRDYQTNAQNNIRVFHEYVSASSFTEAHLPSNYPMIDHVLGDISVTPPEDVAAAPEESVSGAERPADTGSGDESRSRSGGGGGAAPPAGERTSEAPQRTTPSEVVSTSSQAPSAVPPSQPSPGSSETSGQSVVSPGGGPGALEERRRTARGGGPPGTGAGGGGFGGGGFGGGPRAGTGGSGPGAGTPGGSRPGTGAPGGSGPGVRAGAPGAGATGGEEARRGVPTSPRGGGPATTGGVPLGTGSRPADDVEHERKVLLRANPEETFGDDTPTAPPVIGDESFEE